MMNDKDDFRNIITHLVAVEKAPIGGLADACGEAIKQITPPLAIEISLRLPGLAPESYTNGIKRYREYLAGFVRNQGFGGETDETRGSGFVTVTTDTDDIVCIGAIRHFGNTLGHIAAVARLPETGAIPLTDGVNLTISQIESRINALLTPGNPSSLEIFARRLLDSLTETGVCAICVKPEKPAHIVVSIAESDKEISVCEVEEFPFEKPDQVESGSDLQKEEISQLWPDIAGIEAGMWIVDSQNRIIAFGFCDKKRLNKTARTKIEKQLEVSADDDIEYIVQSFEKLKADYKKMVNSERAAAVTETAVTVNHEINNPLTAILGNTQLLLMNKDKLSKETAAKLQTIEKSAIKIREVTDKLMTIIEPIRKHYASGLEMIDVEKSRQKGDEEK